MQGEWLNIEVVDDVSKNVCFETQMLKERTPDELKLFVFSPLASFFRVHIEHIERLNASL